SQRPRSSVCSSSALSSQRSRRGRAWDATTTLTEGCTEPEPYPQPVRVLTVGNMYPPHHFGGYEIVWQAAVEHLRAQGDEVRVLTPAADTGAPEPDPPHVYRELRWPLRDAEFVELGRREKIALSRHNHRAFARHVEELRPDVVSWWSMG